MSRVYLLVESHLIPKVTWFIFISSYRRDAMDKMKMSNGDATDVYLSNSRCVRNNDKPADNHVFTGRLPVSAGPQHHQWQQQQQLLVQADENVA